jgi:hypothetical protein
VIGDKAEQAYRRSDALARRRELMDAWARHCEGSAADNVVTFKRPAYGQHCAKVRPRPKARVQDRVFERAESARKRSCADRVASVGLSDPCTVRQVEHAVAKQPPRVETLLLPAAPVR